MPSRLMCPAGGFLDDSRVNCIDAPPCGEGETRDDTGLCLTKQPMSCPADGNPIQAALANKFQVERDIVGTGENPLSFTRFYNSIPVPASTMGPRWRHTFDRSLLLSSSQTPAHAFMLRPDGGILRFTQNGSAWIADGDLNDRLTQLVDGTGTVTGWTLTLGADDSVESYDPQGILLAITQRSGLTQRLTYGSISGRRYPTDAPACNPPAGSTTPAAGRLWCVTDTYGRQLGFSYEASTLLAKVFDPAGNAYVYGYLVGYLDTVTGPDLFARKYVYNESAFTGGASLPYALTGIVDENGDRFATYIYDTKGRAYWTEHAGSVSRVVLNYQPGVTEVREGMVGYFNPTRTYNFETILGVARVKGITQSSGDDASSNSLTITNDSHGNIENRTDFAGNLTTYTYDLARNLETRRVEASGKPEARTITTDWHGAWRLPKRIAEPLKITTFDYYEQGDGLGKVHTRTEQATLDTNGSQGFAATPTGTPRVWTWTYWPDGQVKTIDGPRTDVLDVTNYTYYTDTVLDANNEGHTVGDLFQITDAKGYITKFTRYDKNGRLLEVRDPNGMATRFEYSPRGWLKSRSVGPATGTRETTTYEYDNLGQLKTLTRPDGSHLTYVHDAAHRLTDIKDGPGNTLHYERYFDEEWHAREVRDPQGNPLRTDYRDYDTQHRLRSVTLPR